MRWLSSKFVGTATNGKRAHPLRSGGFETAQEARADFAGCCEVLLGGESPEGSPSVNMSKGLQSFCDSPSSCTLTSLGL